MMMLLCGDSCLTSRFKVWSRKKLLLHTSCFVACWVSRKQQTLYSICTQHSVNFS